MKGGISRFMTGFASSYLVEMGADTALPILSEIYDASACSHCAMYPTRLTVVLYLLIVLNRLSRKVMLADFCQMRGDSYAAILLPW